MIYKPDMSQIEQDKWRWSGDANMEEGGFFWRPISDDLVEATGIFAHPENPGADYNDESWIIQWRGEIFLRPDDQESVLETCGYEAVDGGIIDSTGTVLSGDEAFTLLVEAAHAYGGIEGFNEEILSRAELANKGVNLDEYVRSELGVEIETEAPTP